ncbi:MAG TPA: PAS domain-containing protein [Candidatus Angelobacter sp.]
MANKAQVTGSTSIKSSPADELRSLANERDRYRELVDCVQAIVWRGSAETFRFTFINSYAETLLGYPVHRWLDEPSFWKDHIHPEDREWAVEFCAKATREKRAHEFDYRMLAADGRACNGRRRSAQGTDRRDG